MLGAVILLKQSDSDAPSKLLNLLAESVSAAQVRAELNESLELNKKMVEEYERVVRRKIEDEDELYTKFRILLSKYQSNE